MRNLQKKLSITLIFLLCTLAVAANINFAKASTYNYQIIGPFYMNGTPDSSDTVVCNLLWSDFTTTQETLGLGFGVVTIVSYVSLYQMTFNASSALNNTALIDFNKYVPSISGYENINVVVPNPSIPFSLYTFPVTDFAGMTNPYLEMSINNASGSTGPAQQVSLSTTGSATFIMTQYYTYTLTFINGDGKTFSLQFTAENTFTNQLTVPSLAFTVLNTTIPTANADRLNDTLIGINYNDPSSLTSGGSITISHQNGASTINDYSVSTLSSSTILLWNAASIGVDYNVTVTSTINGQPYLWILNVPSSASANPWIGIWDWLGSSTPTMPYVSTGWPLGMTTYQIAEIAGGIIIAFFLTIGSFRSSGATCIVAWVMSGFLIAFGWWGNGTVGAVSAIPEFALSGFIAFMVQIAEAKDTVREA